MSDGSNKSALGRLGKVAWFVAVGAFVVWSGWDYYRKLMSLGEPLLSVIGPLVGIAVMSIYWAWQSEKTAQQLQRRLWDLEQRVRQHDLDAVALLRSARFD